MSYAPEVLTHFPVAGVITKPRPSQALAIQEIEKAFREGSRIVILEGPVGCGKTAIATTLARFYRQAHILTPRKSLQDQYYDDFNEYMVLMKGRSAYPCIRWDRSLQSLIYEDIEAGRIQPPGSIKDSCARGPCLASQTQKERCQAIIPMCPYMKAVEVAQRNNIICHNLHSFIFQVNYGGYFDERPFLAIDEAHDAAGILTEFASREFVLRERPKDYEVPPSDAPMKAWQSWLLEDRFLPRPLEERDEYTSRVESLSDREFVPDYRVDDYGRASVKFTPKRINGLAESLIFQYGKRILLMSGTVFGKERFCRDLGINPEDAYYIRMPSSFPVKNRPVYVKNEYLVDTSHREWSNNLPTLAANIRQVLDVFKDVKGLIHVPSYRAMDEVIAAVNDPRLVGHTSEGFVSSLERFYDSPDAGVFVSPVCQQGVDFKNDRARFQIVTRVPYLNAGDAFISHKIETDFAWYNYRALVTFGQMLGRVNRNENDFGVTVLMDSRFVKFIQKNKGLIPKWQYDAFIWR